MLDWFTIHQRPLPWRRTYEPYQVWIAEIMGQQTQMERVVTYFQGWMDRFPDVAAVAAAPEQAILKAWEGLGYYSRARNIHKAAGRILTEFNGEIPSSHRQLLDLPGIGPYTAAAILSIAYNQAYPLLDANVERLFARLDDINRPLKTLKTRRKLESMAAALLDRNDPRHFNQALMELGALICTPKKPACPQCPVQPYCRAYRADTVEFRPLPSARDKRIDIVMACGIIQHHERFFIQQRLADDIWGGLWEFPGGRLLEGEEPVHCVLREVEEETGWQVSDPVFYRTVEHHYTRYRVTLHAFFCRPPEPVPEPVLTAASRFAWVPFAGLADYPFPAGHRQLITALRDGDFSGK
nr:A/G-specific adenine glycosylase [Desulfobulbus alkaliphilus]